MIKNYDVLADRLKGIKIDGKEVTAKDFIEMATSEQEIVLDAPKVNVLFDDEIESLKQTVTGKSKETGYVDGMKAGTEQLVKALRNIKGLEFEGKLKYDQEGKIDFTSTASHVAEHFEKKVVADAKLEPDKKIAELEGKIQKIQKTYEVEKLSWSSKENEFSTKLKQKDQEYFLETNLPQVEGLTKKQLAVLFKTDGNGVDFDENGQPFPTKFGKKVVDNMEKPISFETFAASYIEMNQWGNKKGGRGEGDVKPDGSPKFKTKNEAFKYMEANQIDPFSQKGQDMLKNL